MSTDPGRAISLDNFREIVVRIVVESGSDIAATRRGEVGNGNGGDGRRDKSLRSGRRSIWFCG